MSDFDMSDWPGDAAKLRTTVLVYLDAITTSPGTPASQLALEQMAGRAGWRASSPTVSSGADSGEHPRPSVPTSDDRRGGGKEPAGLVDLADETVARPTEVDPLGCCADALFWCPTAREVSCRIHGGFNVCCKAPELHVPIAVEEDRLINANTPVRGWVNPDWHPDGFRVTPREIVENAAQEDADGS